MLPIALSSFSESNNMPTSIHQKQTTVDSHLQLALAPHSFRREPDRGVPSTGKWSKPSPPLPSALRAGLEVQGHGRLGAAAPTPELRMPKETQGSHGRRSDPPKPLTGGFSGNGNPTPTEKLEKITRNRGNHQDGYPPKNGQTRLISDMVLSAL